MKIYRELYEQIYMFLTLAIVSGELSASSSSYFNPNKYLIGGWVGPKTGLDNVKRRKS
jgi:hypothetical protein